MSFKKDTLISGVNEKDRSMFFNYNKKKITKAMQKVKEEILDDI